MISSKRLEAILNNTEKERKPEVIHISNLPQKMKIEDYAMIKAYAIEDFVRRIHGDMEWYAYLVSKKDNPETVVDVKIVKSSNSGAHTALSESDKLEVIKELKQDEIISGWIHSHNSMYLHSFSSTDDDNMHTVLDIAGPNTKKVLSKKERLFKELSMLVEGDYSKDDLSKGTVSVITDSPVKNLRIFDTEFGMFSYNLLIGKNHNRWHSQAVSSKVESTLKGLISREDAAVELDILKTDKKVSFEELTEMKKDIKDKIRGNSFGSWRGYINYEGSYGGNYGYPYTTPTRIGIQNTRAVSNNRTVYDPEEYEEGSSLHTVNYGNAATPTSKSEDEPPKKELSKKKGFAPELENVYEQNCKIIEDLTKEYDSVGQKIMSQFKKKKNGKKSSAAKITLINDSVKTDDEKLDDPKQVTLEKITSIDSESYSWIRSPTFSPDGKYFAFAINKYAKIYAISREKEGVLSLKETVKFKHPSEVTNVAFNPDSSYLATISNDRFVRMINLRTKKQDDAFKTGLFEYNQPLSFSQDGKYLMVIGGMELKEFNLSEEKSTETLKLKNKAISVCAHPDGKHIIIGKQGPDSLDFFGYDKSGGIENKVLEIKGVSGRSGFVFIPDGKNVITANYSEPLRFYEIGYGDESDVIQTMQTAEKIDVVAGASIAISPCGKYIATTSGRELNIYRNPFKIAAKEESETAIPEKKIIVSKVDEFQEALNTKNIADTYLNSTRQEYESIAIKKDGHIINKR